MMISLSLNPSTMGSWPHILDASPVKIPFKVLGLLIWTTMEKLTGMNFWYDDKYSCGISVLKDYESKVILGDLKEICAEEASRALRISKAKGVDT